MLLPFKDSENGIAFLSEVVALEKALFRYDDTEKRE